MSFASERRGNDLKNFKDFLLKKPRPESGLEGLISAELAQQRSRDAPRRHLVQEFGFRKSAWQGSGRRRAHLSPPPPTAASSGLADRFLVQGEPPGLIVQGEPPGFLVEGEPLGLMNGLPDHLGGAMWWRMRAGRYSER